MKGSIYAIRSHQTKDIYIGSTKETLSRRMANHRRNYKEYITRNGAYISSVEILQYEDAYIELIELIEYNDKSELTAREGHHIRNMDCVNKNIAGRTQKEYKIKYNIDNKQLIKENIAIKITCECGSIIRKNDISIHKKSQKHQKFMQNSA